MKTILYKMDAHSRILYWKGEVTGQTLTTSWGIMEKTTAGLRESASSSQTTTEDCHTPERAVERLNSESRMRVSRKGYTAHIPKSIPMKVMLANDYDEKRFDFEHFAIQPKLDGFRCTATNKGLWSRYDKYIKSVPHIQEALRSLPDGIRLDGELYIHGVDLQSLSSYIKRDFPSPNSRYVEYHIYDIMMVDTTFKDRCNELVEIRNSLTLPPCIKFVSTTYFNEKVVIPSQHDLWKTQGYEGIIIRNVDGFYEFNKRSHNLLKYKEWMDDEFLIVNIEKRKDDCAVLVCKTFGTETDVPLAFTQENKQAVWLQRELHIGKWAKVKFQKVLPSGKLFQPRCEGMYERKEDSK